MGNKEFNQIKYQNEYNKQKYDKLSILLPKGKRDRVKARAKGLGKSVNGYINDMIDRDMEDSRG